MPFLLFFIITLSFLQVYDYSRLELDNFRYVCSRERVNFICVEPAQTDTHRVTHYARMHVPTHTQRSVGRLTQTHP